MRIYLSSTKLLHHTLLRKLYLFSSSFLNYIFSILLLIMWIFFSNVFNTNFKILYITLKFDTILISLLDFIIKYVHTRQNFVKKIWAKMKLMDLLWIRLRPEVSLEAAFLNIIFNHFKNFTSFSWFSYTVLTI